MFIDRLILFSPKITGLVLLGFVVCAGFYRYQTQKRVSNSQGSTRKKEEWKMAGGLFLIALVYTILMWLTRS